VKKRGFSLAEILIATMFMGIIASLTIPSTINSLKYKQHVKAYEAAFKIAEDVYKKSGIKDSTYPSAEKFWALLNDALPVIGYSDVGIKPGGVYPDIVPMTAANLKERATWSDTTLGGSIGSLAKTEHTLFSPWIVTESGMSFALDSWPEMKASLGLDGTCGTVANIFHAKSGGTYTDPTVKAAAISCVFLYIDINGLDKGPNNHPTYEAITEGEAYNAIRDYDRFHIFVGVDGVTAGPEGVVTSYITRKN